MSGLGVCHVLKGLHRYTPSVIFLYQPQWHDHLYNHLKLQCCFTIIVRGLSFPLAYSITSSPMHSLPLMFRASLGEKDFFLIFPHLVSETYCYPCPVSINHADLPESLDHTGAFTIAEKLLCVILLSHETGQLINFTQAAHLTGFSFWYKDGSLHPCVY